LVNFDLEENLKPIGSHGLIQYVLVFNVYI